MTLRRPEGSFAQLILSADQQITHSFAQVEAADAAARAAVTMVLRTAAELRGLARAVGAPTRDGYLHRGKLRARRWLAGALVARTWALLHDVRAPAKS